MLNKGGVILAKTFNTFRPEVFNKLSETVKKKKPPEGKYNFYQTPEQNKANLSTQQDLFKSSNLFGIPKNAITPTKTTTAGTEVSLSPETTMTKTPVGPNTNVVKGTTTQNYYSPYQGDIDKKIQDIMTYEPYKFDVDNPALLQAQKQAIETARRGMAKRGRVFDTYAQIKEQESAQKLIPEFYRLGMNQYESERQNLYNQLSTLRGQETTDYNRYLTDRNYIEAQEREQFGTVLSPTMRDYRQKFLEIPQDIMAELAPLGQQEGGFATTINQLKVTDPTNPMLPYLEIMRANKVLSDPLLMEQYGTEYGMQTGQILGVSQQAEQTQALNQLEILKGKAEYAQYLVDIAKVEADIKKIEADARNKDADTLSKEYDVLMKELEYLNLPEKLKQDLNAVIALSAQRYASAKSSIATAELTSDRMATERLNRDLLEGKISEQEFSTKLEEAKLKNENLRNLELSKEAKKDDRLVSSAYVEYLNSGKDVKEWLVSPKILVDESGQPFTDPTTNEPVIIVDEKGKPILNGNTFSQTEIEDFLDIVAEREPANKDLVEEVLAGIIKEKLAE